MSVGYSFNSHEPVNQQIYRKLRQEIVCCQIDPGALLSEKEISLRFSVSRQPVREAFIKLAEAGLVQILPQRGTFVKKISAERVADARFIREAVELAVVKQAAEKCDAEHLFQLEDNLLQQRRAALHNDRLEFLRLDDAFHQQIAQSTGNLLAWETIENIKATMDRVRFLTLEEVTPPVVLIEQHQIIFNALKAQDSDAAERGMRDHLRQLALSIEPITAQNAAWFE